MKNDTNDTNDTSADGKENTHRQTTHALTEKAKRQIQTHRTTESKTTRTDTRNTPSDNTFLVAENPLNDSELSNNSSQQVFRWSWAPNSLQVARARVQKRQRLCRRPAATFGLFCVEEACAAVSFSSDPKWTPLEDAGTRCARAGRLGMKVSTCLIA